MSAMRDDHLAEDLTSKDILLRRRALSKVLTLVESSRIDHRQRGDELLDELFPKTGSSFRIGITGPPGSGKSTLVNAIGLMLIEQGHRVAVLCVDPSSNLSDGCVLADKTRMHRLACCENAYIRPSAGSAGYGGVAQQTRAAIRLCEAAAYDFVIVETVGVGQNEYAVAEMTDMVLLLQGPHPMDDLQVIKKGVYEHVDLVVVNKVDLARTTALAAQARIASALRLTGYGARHLSPLLQRTPRVCAVSAVTGDGLSILMENIALYKEEQVHNIARRREIQDKAWLEETIGSQALSKIKGDASLQSSFNALVDLVQAARIAPPVAARQILTLAIEHPEPFAPENLNGATANGPSLALMGKHG